LCRGRLRRLGRRCLALLLALVAALLSLLLPLLAALLPLFLPLFLPLLLRGRRRWRLLRARRGRPTNHKHGCAGHKECSQMVAGDHQGQAPFCGDGQQRDNLCPIEGRAVNAG
jgi:hypothetical protein